MEKWPKLEKGKNSQMATWKIGQIKIMEIGEKEIGGKRIWKWENGRWPKWKMAKRRNFSDGKGAKMEKWPK